MTRQIFREAALRRLGNADRLDRPSRLVRPQAWLALAVLIAGCGGALAWTLAARAPVKVNGQGILFEEGLLMDVVAAVPGRIAELMLEPGATVRTGQLIARIDRPDLDLDIAKARADLNDSRSRYVEIERFHRENEAREVQTEEARLESLKVSQRHVARRVQLLEEKAKGIQDLSQRNLVVRDRLIEAELELANARERFSQLDDEGKLLAMRRQERQSKMRLALLDEQMKVNEIERRLGRLEGQRKDEQSIVSAHDGRVAEVKVSRGDVVAAGTPLATLIRANQPGAGAVALVYVSARDGRRIRKGMATEIVPTITLKEEYGFISGQVEEVSDVASTAQGMRAVLKNEQLAAKLAGDGAPIAVRVRLDVDAETATGLKWSASKGPPQRIPTGTLLASAIVVDRVPILALLAPGLDRLAVGDGR